MSDLQKLVIKALCPFSDILPMYYITHKLVTHFRQKFDRIFEYFFNVQYYRRQFAISTKTCTNKLNISALTNECIYCI